MQKSELKIGDRVWLSSNYKDSIKTEYYIESFDVVETNQWGRKETKKGKVLLKVVRSGVREEYKIQFESFTYREIQGLFDVEYAKHLAEEAEKKAYAEAVESHNAEYKYKARELFNLIGKEKPFISLEGGYGRNYHGVGLSLEELELIINAIKK